MLLLGGAGLMAGFVDAVVGGGGLIQLPAILLGLPGASPVQVLGTNKLASICGTSVSSATYYRRVRPDPRTFGPLMLLAFAGSALGAVVAAHIPEAAFEPLVLVALVLVGGYVLFRPSLGGTTALRFSGHRHTMAAMLTGLGIGFYDGALGPGTGSFFVFTLVGLLGYSFLEASAKARLANWATNLAALCIFVPQGGVLWKVGLVMGACNLAGGYLGARTAVARGTRFVRIFFIAVVTAFIVRIGGGLAGVW
nr:TSUP family transporter [Nocardioides panaciterrulae]